MKRACIAVVDAARARIYLYQERTNPGYELQEVRDLANPGRRLKDSELFSDSRPGLTGGSGRRLRAGGGNRSDSGEPGSAFDDHRDAHIEEMDVRFAKEIVAEVDDQVRRRHLGHLVVIAAPRMLGTLRANIGVLHRDGLVLEEIDKDLSNLTGPQLHDYLAQHDIVPPRQRLTMAR